MGFVEAVRSGFHNYANVNGRAPRSAYWWWAAFAVPVTMWPVLANVARYATGGAEPSSALNAVAVATYLALLPAWLSLMVRRLHDSDRSGWWLVATAIPVAGWVIQLVLMAWPETSGQNRYGLPYLGDVGVAEADAETVAAAPVTAR